MKLYCDSFAERMKLLHGSVEGMKSEIGSINVNVKTPDFKPSMKNIFEVDHETISKEEFEKREMERNKITIKKGKE